MHRSRYLSVAAACLAASLAAAQDMRPAEVPMTTQERAYTSPIWYAP